MRWLSLARACSGLIPMGSAAILTLSTVTPAWAQSPAAPALSASPATALSAAPLTLVQALALAMASNAELAVAQRELAAAQGPVVQGRARLNPELSLQFEDTRQATRTSTLQLSQPFELGGQRAARITAAEHSRDMAAAALAAKRADLQATVVLAFHEVALAQEGVKLAADTVALAQRASDAATKRVQAGKVAPIDETKARIAQAAAELEAAQANADLTLARLRLAALWGQASLPFERVQTAGTGGSSSTPQALAARLAASPNLRRAQIEVQRRHALTDLERGRRMPNVTLSLGVKRDEQLGRNQAMVGLSLPLPVFDSNRGNLLEAVQREEQSRDELAVVGIRLHTAVMQASSQLAAANALARAIRDQVLPGALIAFEATTKGFELGKFNFLDVLDAQRTLFQAKSQHQRALGDAQRALADIDRLLGDVSDVAVATAAPSQIQE